MEIFECPKCRRRYTERPTYCECGWPDLTPVNGPDVGLDGDYANEGGFRHMLLRYVSAAAIEETVRVRDESLAFADTITNSEKK